MKDSEVVMLGGVCRGPRHHHPGLCHSCLASPTQHRPLQRCAQCHLVLYCSRGCQRRDWSIHRMFCLAHKVRDTRSVFWGVPRVKGDQAAFREFRSCLRLAASLNLGRRLMLHEDEVLLFPRVCEVCGMCAAVEGCAKCHSVFYCSAQHCTQDAERHNNWCHLYQLCVECDRAEFKSLHQDLALSTEVDQQHQALPPTMTAHLQTTLNFGGDEEKTNLSDMVSMALMSEHLSYPLSLLSALQHVCPQLCQMPHLTLHIVGAERGNELLHDTSWEYFLHRLPLLRHLHLVFIGPHLCLPEEYLMKTVQCHKCHEAGRAVVYQTFSGLYHHYITTSQYTHPDAFVAYNCGFHEFRGEESDTWPPSLTQMLQATPAPLVFTSYNRVEAEKDLEAVKMAGAVEVLIPPGLNHYHSLRPLRDWTREDDFDLYYTNHYVTCVRGTSQT